MSVSRHATYNMIGAILPAVLTLATVPAYLAVVGLERYGVLTLCWVLVGYAGILDVGLGLAAARKIAASRDDREEAEAVFWTTAAISLAVGSIAAILMYAGATFYFSTLTDDNPALYDELMGSAPMLALMMPLALIGSAINGALTGRERFGVINAANTLSQTLMAVLPLTIAYFWTTDLRWLVAGLLLARFLPVPWTYRVARRAVPLTTPKRPTWSRARELLTQGGWMSLIFAANSVLQTLDRMLIGSRVGPSAVPIYAIPYGLVSKVILVPHSLSIALFPRYAYVPEEERRRLNSSSIQAVAVIVTPALIGLVAIAQPFFTLWVGAELAAASLPVAYVLAGGFWFYCIGHMGYSMLQAIGRPDLVAKVLLAELIPYVVLLVAGLALAGVLGAAAAFTLRAGADCLIFLRLARVPARTWRWLLVPAAMTSAAILAAALIPGPLRYLPLGALLAIAGIWSLLNIPDALQPYLGRFAGLIPARFRKPAQAGESSPSTAAPPE
jgi:O-antigen/teichoic acid export membrane protein